jgi:hypothetical protein
MGAFRRALGATSPPARRNDRRRLAARSSWRCVADAIHWLHAPTDSRPARRSRRIRRASFGSARTRCDSRPSRGERGAPRSDRRGPTWGDDSGEPPIRRTYRHDAAARRRADRRWCNRVEGPEQPGVPGRLPRRNERGRWCSSAGHTGDPGNTSDTCRARGSGRPCSTAPATVAPAMHRWCCWNISTR